MREWLSIIAGSLLLVSMLGIIFWQAYVDLVLYPLALLKIISGAP